MTWRTLLSMALEGSPLLFSSLSLTHSLQPELYVPFKLLSAEY